VTLLRQSPDRGRPHSLMSSRATPESQLGVDSADYYATGGALKKRPFKRAAKGCTFVVR
jgi:hypothetical protein